MPIGLKSVPVEANGVTVNWSVVEGRGKGGGIRAGKKTMLVLSKNTGDCAV